jgi:hypothetical protein
MRQLFADLFQFGWLIIIHWGAYVTGGIPWVADGALQRLSAKYRDWADRNSPFRRRVEIAALLCGFLVASFQAWQDEHISLQHMEDRAVYAENQWGIQKQRATDAEQQRAALDKSINGRSGYLDQIQDLKIKLAAKPPTVVIREPSRQAASPQSSTPSPCGDEYTVCQYGAAVARVNGVFPDPAHGIVRFDEIMGGNTFNSEQDFQFRNWTLHIQDESLGGSVSGLGIAQPADFHRNVTCKIVGPAKKP